ncbi:hypothetical protein [Corynebacterium sp. MC3]|uniref:SWIM zinc finger family protein n=1 Tax=Corynebacterium sp. MC3 TaxID=1720193 RepID=UPI0008DA2FD7|nr:hypothetical protein [Corynebacterium sp. MC3]
MSTQRPREDNVIYANFGARRRSPEQKQAKQASETRSRYKDVPATWNAAGRRIWEAVVRYSDAGRIKRGIAYANGGHVAELYPRLGGIDAVVTGSQIEPFHTVIELPRRTAADIGGLLSDIAHDSAALMKARNGVYTDEALDTLIANGPEEFRLHCSCPDPAVACKHIVAVGYQAAQRMSEHHEFILQLRDSSIARLTGMAPPTVQHEAAQPDAPGEVTASTPRPQPDFWEGGALPDLPTPKVAPMIEDSDITMLHKAMQTISFTNIDQLRAVSDIEDLFYALTETED